MSQLHMLDNPQRVVDTRNQGDRQPLTFGQEFTVPVAGPPGIDVKAAVATFTFTAPTGPVHLILDHPVDLAGQAASFNNDDVGNAPSPNTTLVNVRDGRITGRIGGRPPAPSVPDVTVHLIVDLIAVIS